MPVEVVVNHALIAEWMTSPTSPVGRHLVGVTQDVAQESKRVAPVGKQSKTPEGHPAGYLRSQIGWELVSARSMTAKVEAVAMTSKANVMPGEDYAYQNETGWHHRGLPVEMRGHPFLEPALRAVFARM